MGKETYFWWLCGIFDYEQINSINFNFILFDSYNFDQFYLKVNYWLRIHYDNSKLQQMDKSKKFTVLSSKENMSSFENAKKTLQDSKRLIERLSSLKQ